MSSERYEFTIKGTIKELLTYKSGIFGIAFLILLVTLSVYTIVVLPYDQTIKLWRGEGGVWLETPRTAQPYWVNYFGQNLPETIKRDSSQSGQSGTVKIVTPIPQSGLKLARISFTFDFLYDSFPSEINIFFSVKFNESSPLLNIYWVKPSGTEIRLLTYIPRSQNDKLYLSINSEVSNALSLYVYNVLGGASENPLPP